MLAPSKIYAVKTKAPPIPFPVWCTTENNMQMYEIFCEAAS